MVEKTKRGMKEQNQIMPLHYVHGMSGIRGEWKLWNDSMENVPWCD